MKVGIVGLGHVGRAMTELFPHAAVYDIHPSVGSREEINLCDIAFVCVPTPAAEDGSCDTSIVEDVLQWLTAPIIVLRSTVPIGFTDKMRIRLQKRILFQPEYYGETPGHPFADLRQRAWVTLGGPREDCDIVAKLYTQCYPLLPTFYFVSAREAELAKYMTNAFLAAKVVFCNTMYDLAQATGTDYEAARSAWLADPRIGDSHTLVYPHDRGYGGSCFPKDVEALRSMLKKASLPTHYLNGVIRQNQYFRSMNKEEE